VNRALQSACVGSRDTTNATSRVSPSSGVGRRRRAAWIDRPDFPPPRYKNGNALDRWPASHSLRSAIGTRRNLPRLHGVGSCELPECSGSRPVGLRRRLIGLSRDPTRGVFFRRPPLVPPPCPVCFPSLRSRVVKAGGRFIQRAVGAVRAPIALVRTCPRRYSIPLTTRRCCPRRPCFRGQYTASR